MTKKAMFFFNFLIVILMTSCSEKIDLVTIHTPYGEMKAILYDETPQHKANFLKLAEEGIYDSTIFHRVIKGFMVQGGDVNQKTGVEEKIDYTIPAEFHTNLIHEKGALAAARQGDQVNPEKASSGCQFYIVQGTTFTEKELDDMINGQNNAKVSMQFKQLLNIPKYSSLRDSVFQKLRTQDFEGVNQLMEASKPLIIEEFGELEELTLTREQKDTYINIGGAPHLDGAYTVFGKVIAGLDIIDSIANQPTGQGDKPLENIYMTITVEKINKNKLQKLYDE